MNEPLKGAFDPIVLCLSGGGGRAAAFHFGVLSYLADLDILQDVRILSTASGGTFPAFAYVLALKQARPGEASAVTFQRCFDTFYHFLSCERIVELTFEQFKSGRHAKLITALADVYHQTLTGGTSFSVLLDDDPLIHVEAFYINAVEGHSGDGFRFAVTPANKRDIFGNKNVSITDEQARHIRCADALASCCCLPGALEPLRFPRDFQWPADGPGSEIPGQIEARFREKNLDPPSVALIDGGVFDNQGIDAAFIALGQKGEGSFKDRPPKLFFISDAPRPQDNLYYPDPPRPPSRLTLFRVRVIFEVLLVLVAIAFLVGVVNLFLTFTAPVPFSLWRGVSLVFQYLVPLLLTAAVGVGLLFVKRKGRAFLAAIPELNTDPNVPAWSRSWNTLGHLTVNQLLDMLQDRLTSLFALVSDLFIHRIRALGYRRVFQKYEPVTLSNELYDLLKLTGKHDDTLEGIAPRLGLPERFFDSTPAIQELARQACAITTRFWWEPPKPGEVAEFDRLIACGQISACYNLIEHLARRFDRQKYVIDPAQRAVFDQACRHWEQLKQDPCVLLERRKNSAAVAAAR